MENRSPTLILEHMSKAFGTVRAVQDVSIEIYPGEIRGLIGENGSGKSTLSAMVCGSLKPDNGSMVFDGKPYAPKSIIDARSKGVCILLQERGTISGMSVAENIFIGMEDDFKGFLGIDKRRMEKRAQQILQEIGADHIHPADPVDRYKFEDRKLIEVARALYTDPKILIIDETTSALSLKGREYIYKIVERFKSQGKSVIFIGHDLDEIVKVCDTATVLKDGRFMKTLSGEEMTPVNMRSLMIGRENLGHYYRTDFVPTYSEQVVLNAEHMCREGCINDVSLQLHKGEILGICGLSDSGMHDIAKALFGALPLDSGKVELPLLGKQIRNPAEAVKAKMAYLPKDRDSESLFLPTTIRDNISVTCFDQKPIGPLINNRHLYSVAQQQANVLNLKCSSIQQLVSELSGGNKQKVVVAKWLANNADILIMDCPTRGIDVGVKASIYDLISSLKEEGKSIIILSEEMAEVIGMADRLIVIKDGCISGEFIRSADLTEQMLVEKII
ncbi:MAG: sugar ABC transporter ATP-binding protein [Candidatus Faecousia sp.]|nr:sugar ABC transporter ATP-binding protein [Candidatus Faecousia sp.]